MNATNENNAPALMVLELPGFPGFYCSRLSDNMDYEEETLAENLGNDGDNGPDFPYPNATGAEVAEALFHVTDHAAAYRAVAKDYAETFCFMVNEAREERGLPPLAFAYDRMESPREYNFVTDRVFVTLPPDDFAAMVAGTDGEVFAAIVREQCTSRDGFISFYSNDSDDWLQKPLDEWDHNEAGVMFLAHVVTLGDGDADHVRCIHDDVMSALYECNSYGDALDAAIDWTTLEKKLNGDNNGTEG